MECELRMRNKLEDTMDIKNRGHWFSLPMNKTQIVDMSSEILRFKKCFKENNMPSFYFGCMGDCIFKTYKLKTQNEFTMMDDCVQPCILEENFDDPKIKSKYIK